MARVAWIIGAFLLLGKCFTAGIRDAVGSFRAENPARADILRLGAMGWFFTAAVLGAGILVSPLLDT